MVKLVYNLARFIISQIRHVLVLTRLPLPQTKLMSINVEIGYPQGDSIFPTLNSVNVGMCVNTAGRRRERHLINI